MADGRSEPPGRGLGLHRRRRHGHDRPPLRRREGAVKGERVIEVGCLMNVSSDRDTTLRSWATSSAASPRGSSSDTLSVESSTISGLPNPALKEG